MQAYCSNGRIAGKGRSKKDKGLREGSFALPYMKHKRQIWNDLTLMTKVKIHFLDTSGDQDRAPPGQLFKSS
jgi:hypothetical protein